MVQVWEDRFDCLGGSHISLGDPDAPFEIECTTIATQRDVAAPKQAAQRASLTARTPPGLRRSSRDLTASFTKTNQTENLGTDDDFLGEARGPGQEFSTADGGSLRSVADGEGSTSNVARATPPACRARLAARMSSGLRASSRDLTASFTNVTLAEGMGAADDEDDASARQVARSVADECFWEEPGQESVTGDDADAACSEPRHAILDPAEALALEVGLSAHEYLLECFQTEDSVLDRERFDAVPEIAKSGFRVSRHLGRGTFSDVFEVVCMTDPLNAKESHGLLDPKRSSGILGGAQLTRRSVRGRRATLSGPTNVGLALSSSINEASLARPAQSSDRRVFAMKCLRPQIRVNEDQFTVGAEDLVHETAILANISHRHIIKLHGRAPGQLANAFVSNDGYFILLDKLKETLHDRIAAWRQSPCGVLQGLARRQIEVARDIADAVAYLHSKNILFRDLKPANVGFDGQGVLKLFDFGFAIACKPDGLLFDRCGTPRYMAPEVGLEHGYGMESDSYSFGILLWEICTLSKPFPHITSSKEFARAVFVGGERPAIKDHWPTALRNLIGGCWSSAPSVRPTMLAAKSLLSSITNVRVHRKPFMKTLRSSMARRRSSACWYNRESRGVSEGRVVSS